MKKSIFLFFAAILCAMSISAANMKGGEVLYLKPNSNWTQSNAWFAIYLCNGTSGATWVKMTKSGDYYMATVPTGDYKNVIFCRMNNANTTKLDWSNKWNQSGDLSFDQKKNLCTINSGQWDCGSNVTWSTYQPVSDASLTSSAANIFVGGQATLTAKLSSNTNVNTLKSTSYAIAPSTGASISGNTFTATAAGEYTVTATLTYYPNGCTSLTSGLKTATATTTIVAEVPAEEVHDVTVSYICGETKLQDPTTVNTVGVETESEVTAPAKIKGYIFVNWTIGSGVINTTGNNNTNIINILTKSTGDYTLTANYEPETVYFVNTDEWENVGAYAWTKVGSTETKNAAWPGVALTATGEKIGGYDVYSYTLGDGFENVIFTNINGTSAKNQTPDLKWVAGKYYVYNGQGNIDADDWYAKEDVEEALPDWLATNVHLVGNMFANWDKTPDKEFRKATKDATTASIVVTLEANKDYELKVRRGDDWTSCTSKITNTVSNLQFSTSNNDNCKMETTVAGDYTFTWTINTSKLAVTYPTICAITATANDAAMGTIAGVGNYGKGSTATLTATPNDGYLFVNWTKGGVEVATTQEYSFKVEDAVELVANFEAAPEEVHNVTVSYICSGNKIADDQTVAAVGETTPKTAEAPEIWGYTFSSWKLGAGVTSTDATANPISINIVAGGSDYTLTANYTEIPKVTIYFVNNSGWSKVNAYGWKDGEAQGTPAWPGVALTATGEKVADFDVYSYSVVPGSYDNIIFNNGSGTQTETYKWTDGNYYWNNEAKNFAGGTKAQAEEKLSAPVEYDYVYLINTNDWTKAYIYTWESGVASWPGAQMTKEATQIAGKDVYSYKVVKGTTFGGLNFNCGSDACKTGDLTWQAGKYYAPSKNTWYDTKEAAEAALAAPVEYDYVYLINTNDWTKAYIYTWESGVASWPGAQMTKEATQIAGKDVYSYKVVKGTTFGGLNFNCGGDECKTGDLTWQAGKYYAPSTGEWYADAAAAEAALAATPAPAKCYLMGIGGDWTTGIEMEEDGDQFKLLCQPIAEGEQFKFKHGDIWSDGVQNYDFPGIKWVDDDNDGNSNITLPAGNYNFYYKKNENNVRIEVCTPATPTPDYTREVDPQYYGTICLPKAGKFVGGSLYEVAHYDVTTKKVYFDEVLNGEMEAGMPYIFLANATKIEAYYTSDEESAAQNKKGLYGTLVDITSGMNEDGVYMIYRNQIIHSIHPGSYLNANRAYIKLTEVPGYNDPSYVAPAPAPGRKRIAIGQAPQVATGMENVDASAQPVKMIIDGQLYILRGEKMYDAQGKLVK